VAAMVLLRHSLATAALGVLEEGDEHPPLLLALLLLTRKCPRMIVHHILSSQIWSLVMLNQVVIDYLLFSFGSLIKKKYDRCDYKL
jgi:hypothetical protein